MVYYWSRTGFNFSTSSSTDETLTPAERFGGSVIDRKETRELISLISSDNPSDEAVSVAMGLDLAFIMLGRVAYRGSFKRKSVVISAGKGQEMVSKPPSISRVTLTTLSFNFKSTLEAKVA